MATTFLVKAWIGPVGPVGQCRNAEECVFFFASIIRLHYGITVLRMWRARNDPVYLVQVSASFFFFFLCEIKIILVHPLHDLSYSRDSFGKPYQLLLYY